MTTIHYLKGDATAPSSGGRRIICHICNDIGGWGRATACRRFATTRLANASTLSPSERSS